MTAATLETNPFEDLTPGMPRAPEDIARNEGYFRAEDSYEIYWQTWTPTDLPVRGGVALMHGYGEHSARYHHVASALCRLGFGVFAIDARGHGRSSGKRAFISSFEEYARDFDQLIKRCGEMFEGPTFCLGHSYGGLVALHHAFKGEHKPACYAITSPFCGFAGKVPAVKAFAGNVMSKIYPAMALPTELDTSKLTHIDEVVQKYKRDPLVLSIATARWFTETKLAHAELHERASEIETPFLYLVAGADIIVDPEATEKVYHVMGSVDRELEIFPTLYHELLNEREWPSITQKIADWFERHEA